MDSSVTGNTCRLAMGVDPHHVPRPVGALFGCTVHRMGVTSVIELCGELVNHFELAFGRQHEGREMLSDVGFEVAHV